MERLWPDQRLARGLLGAAGLMLAASAVASFAQGYPSRTARIVVPRAPSGATDLLARMVAEKLRDTWGQPFIVENRPGAGGIVGTEYVARSKPDGYTMLMAINSHTTNLSLHDKLAYEPFKDFQPLILVATSPNIIVSHPSLPARTVGELVKLAKLKPGEVTYGSGGSGSGSHLAAVLFARMAGIDWVHVPYKGVTLAVVDLIGGQVNVSIPVVAVAYPHMRSGRLRGIAVTGAKRSALVPEISTVAEAGFKGYDVVSWFGLLLPAHAPAEVVAKLNGEIDRITKSADVRGKMLGQGIELAGGTPQQFGDFMRADWELWDRVIREAGVKIR